MYNKFLLTHHEPAEKYRLKVTKEKLIIIT